MGSVNLKWTPGGGTTTGQRILKIAKVNGITPNDTDDFTVANDMDAVQSTNTANSLADNTIYRFKVQSLCPTGGPLNNTNGILEAMVFACLEEGVSIDTTTSSITISIELPNPTPVDGGAIIANYSDINGIEFSLYDSSGTVLLQGPSYVARSGNPYTSAKTLTGLVTGFSYIVKYVMVATVNGGAVRSDGYILSVLPCETEVITLP